PVRSRAVSQAGTVAQLLAGDVRFDERQLREVALRWLELRNDGGRQSLSLDDIKDFDGGFSLADAAAELWQPPGFDGLLSIRDERDVERVHMRLDGLTLTPAATVMSESLAAVGREVHPLI